MGAPRGIGPRRKKTVDDLLGSIVHYLCRRRDDVQPLLDRLFAQGFALHARRRGKTLVLNELLAEIYADPDHYTDALRRFTRSRGGQVILLHHGRDLLRLTYDSGWNAGVAFDFLDDRDLDLLMVQDALFGAFTGADVAAIIDLCADYLVERRTAPFHYELTAASGTFLTGRLTDGVLRVEMCDLFVYLKLMFFLLRKNVTRVIVKSPLDIMRLAEQGRHTVKHLAVAYDRRELLLVIELRGCRVMELGRGVKPIFGSRFGPTSIKLSALAGVLKSMMPEKG